LTVNRKAGETGIVSLKIGKESKPVLIRATQKHPLTGQILHIDFYQVNLKEKVKVEIPIEIIGESPAVEKSEGLLLTPITEIEVEALPTELPESIKVDISKLAHIDDAVLIKNLKIPPSVKIFAEPDETVVKIGELVTKEMEEIEAEIESEKVEAVEETTETQDKESAEEKTEVPETPEQQE
jgi:large subunit ribosomal protein L25